MLRICEACGRDVDRQQWPFSGQLCGHCDEWTMRAAGEPERVIELATADGGNLR